MILTIKCRADGCRQIIREDVAPGYSLGPIIKRHGWTAAPSGYYCPNCQDSIPANDYAVMNQGDERAG